MSNTQATAGTIATVAAGLFAGCALGVSAVYDPTLAEVDPSGKSAAQHFAAMYKRAAPLQGGLALAGAVAAGAAAAQGGHCSRALWGGSGALLFAVWPYTLLAMMPTNNKLLGKAPLAPGDDAGALAKRWGRLHLVRTAAGAASFTIMALALARLKHKQA